LAPKPDVIDFARDASERDQALDRSVNCKRVTLLERHAILLHFAVYTIVWFRVVLQVRSLDHEPGIVWLSGAVVKDFKYAADLEKSVKAGLGMLR